MEILQTPEITVDQHQQIADGLVAFTNQVSEEIVRLFHMGKEMMWNRPDFTTADAQLVIDKLGANAILIFQLSAALGQFINTTYPGSLQESELTSPVPYAVVNGAIVLDENAEYPGPKNQ